MIALYAIKSNRKDIAPLEGDVILDASQVFSQLNKPEVSMTMNSSASKDWAKLTTELAAQGNKLGCVLF
jgi:protein translocase subunit secF/protein translocase subunit secD